MVKVSHLYTYPIKSSKAIAHNKVALESRGFQHDRRMALIDRNNKIMTGRDHPQLLKLIVTAQQGSTFKIEIDSNNLTVQESDFSPVLSAVNLWSTEQHPARLASSEVSEWFSDQLNVKCQLVYMDDNCRRSLPEKVPSNYRGHPSDIVSYADDFPVLLTNAASLDDLNAKLDIPVTQLTFRPNIVIEGLEAFAEENFKTLTVGGCEFEIAQACPRCVFTTIDPNTGIKRSDQEPLRTLAKYRNRKGYGVPFGIQIVPRKLGLISVGDTVIFFK